LSSCSLSEYQNRIFSSKDKSVGGNLAIISAYTVRAVMKLIAGWFVAVDFNGGVMPIANSQRQYISTLLPMLFDV